MDCIYDQKFSHFIVYQLNLYFLAHIFNFEYILNMINVDILDLVKQPLHFTDLTQLFIYLKVEGGLQNL